MVSVDHGIFLSPCSTFVRVTNICVTASFDCTDLFWKGMLSLLCQNGFKHSPTISTVSYEKGAINEWIYVCIYVEYCFIFCFDVNRLICLSLFSILCSYKYCFIWRYHYFTSAKIWSTTSFHISARLSPRSTKVLIIPRVATDIFKVDLAPPVDKLEAEDGRVEDDRDEVGSGTLGRSLAGIDRFEETEHWSSQWGFSDSEAGTASGSLEGTSWRYGKMVKDWPLWGWCKRISTPFTVWQKTVPVQRRCAPRTINTLWPTGSWSLVVDFGGGSFIFQSVWFQWRKNGWSQFSD